MIGFKVSFWACGQRSRFAVRNSGFEPLQGYLIFLRRNINFKNLFILDENYVSYLCATVIVTLLPLCYSYPCRVFCIIN